MLGERVDDLERDVSVARCQFWAWGATSASAKRRNWSRIAWSVSSRPASPIAPSCASAISVGEPRAVGAVFPSDQRLDRAGLMSGDEIVVQPEIGKAHDFALVHRDAAKNLGEVFAEADLCHEFSVSPKRPFFTHAQGVGGHLLDRLDIGREPCKPVGGMLLRFDFRRRKFSVDAEPFRKFAAARARNSPARWASGGKSSRKFTGGSQCIACAATSRVEGPLAIRISEHGGSRDRLGGKAIHVDVAERVGSRGCWAEAMPNVMM